MKPSEFKSIIKARHLANLKRAIMVESSPGIGKTQICAQVAAELGIGFKAIHAPLLQPEDYGFPVIAADRSNVSFIVSREKFPVVGSDCPESGILLIDELSQADNSSQKILANLIQERQIHGQRLKEGWTIIATGNRVTDRAGANRLLSHLRNRLTTLELEVSIDDWSQWALSNSVKVEIIAFIRFRPELLNSFDPHAETNPTPRAWVEGVSADLGVVDSAHEFSMFSGAVGAGPAAEFSAFLKLFRKLPSPDVILLDPANAQLPTEPATLYALCGAMANKTTHDNFSRFMTYVGRMSPEFHVLYIRDAIRCKTPKNGKPCGNCNRCAVTQSADFIQWASGQGAKVLL